MIKAAFLTPHSPILIPAIGKNNGVLLAKTAAAYQIIETRLLKEEIDTIIIITPHGAEAATTPTLNVAPSFNLGFAEFGDLATKAEIKGDPVFAQEIKEALKPEMEIKLISQVDLDYGSAIPLYLLLNAVKKTKVITLTHFNGTLENHFNFGRALYNLLENTPRKVAVIASGDLSHRLKRSSPAGYSSKGAKFDNKLIEYLNQPETAIKNILNFDEKLINDVMECGLKSIAVLMGILENKKCEPQMLAYQTEIGVGYLTMDFLPSAPSAKPSTTLKK